jgi:hypothetical protein
MKSEQAVLPNPCLEEEGEEFFLTHECNIEKILQSFNEELHFEQP